MAGIGSTGKYTYILCTLCRKYLSKVYFMKQIKVLKYNQG